MEQPQRRDPQPQEETGTAAGPGPAKRARRWPVGRRTRLLVAGAAAVVVVGGGAAAVALHHEGEGHGRTAAEGHGRTAAAAEDGREENGGPHRGRDGRGREGRAQDGRGARSVPAPLPATDAADAVVKASSGVPGGKVESLRAVTGQGGGRSWQAVVVGPDGVRHQVTVDGASDTITGNTVLGG